MEFLRATQWLEISLILVKSRRVFGAVKNNLKKKLLQLSNNNRTLIDLLYIDGDDAKVKAEEFASTKLPTFQQKSLFTKRI